MPKVRTTALVRLSTKTNQKLDVLAKIFKKQKKEVVEMLIDKNFEETMTSGLTDAYIVKNLPNGIQRVQFKLGEQ